MQAIMKRAQQQYSPAQLQATVVNVCATNQSQVEIKDIPREILSLSDTKPFFGWIMEDEAGHRMLNVEWGGEMFSWGIGVCPPGGVLVTNIRGANIYYWSDGVFFYYE
jgi:hypothetical protein